MTVLNLFVGDALLGKNFPVVFISHGDTGFLSIKRSNEIINWTELRRHFNALNAAMEGQLVVLMACCHGFYGYKIDQRDTSSEAFFGVVGPMRTISPEESIQSNEIFFKSIIEYQEIPIAVQRVNEALKEDVYKCLTAQDNKL